MDGGKFLITDWGGGVWTSVNGLEWQLEVVGSVDQVIWDGSRFLGIAGQNAVVSADGQSWGFLGARESRALGLTLSARMNDLIKMEDGYVVVGDQGLVYSSPDGIEWFRTRNFRDTRSTTSLKAVAHSDFAIIAVGENEIWRSRRFRESFEMILVDGAPYYADIAWNGSVFVTVGGGKIYSSPDGFGWTLVHDWSQANLQSITWTGTEWLVSGSLPNANGASAGLVATSQNLVSWSVENGQVGVIFDEVVSAAGVYLASSSNGNLWVLSDGRWQAEDPGLSGPIKSMMAVPDGIRVFSGGGMVSHRSTAGVWTPGYHRVEMTRVDTLVSGGGTILAVGRDGEVRYSSDGVNWYVSQNTEGFEDVVWFEGKFRSVSGNTIYATDNSEVWEIDSVIENSLLQSLEVFQGRLFVAGNSAGGRAVWEWSENGWTLQHSIGATNQRNYELAASPLFMIASEGAILVNDVDNGQLTMNGTDWVRLSQPEISGRALNVVIHTPFGFVAAGENRILRSDDGENWETVFVLPGETFNDLTYADGLLVAIGSEIVTSEDGIYWQRQAGGFSGELMDIAWSGEGFLAVGSGLATLSENGYSWTSVTDIPPLTKVIWDDQKWLAFSGGGELMSSIDGMTWSYDSFFVETAGVSFANGYSSACQWCRRCCGIPSRGRGTDHGADNKWARVYK